MGKVACQEGHEFVVTNVGAGISRRECRRCDAVIIDLDAEGRGERSVSAPGLFGPAKPTIFTVLAEERRASERSMTGGKARSGSGHAFGGAFRRR